MNIPYEYFCKSCGQLRACFDPELVGCGNCGSMKIITGDLLSLDKDKLKKRYEEDQHDKGEE